MPPNLSLFIENETTVIYEGDLDACKAYVATLGLRIDNPTGRIVGYFLGKALFSDTISLYDVYRADRHVGVLMIPKPHADWSLVLRKAALPKEAD